MNTKHGRLARDVKAMLRDGYGIEDIVLRLKVTEASLRAYVAALRSSGKLLALFDREGA